MAETMPVLGLIAGRGQLPLDIIAQCQAEGRPFFILAIKGQTPEAVVNGYPHAWVHIGEVGAALDHLTRAGVTDLVLAGAIDRPSFSAIKPDREGAKLVARLGMKRFLGDDSLLSALVAYFEQKGFRIVGADSLIGDGVMAEGPLGRLAMPAGLQKDVAFGLKAVKTLGALDIGQGVVIQGGRVIAVEAAEGTDGMLARCAALLKGKEPAVFIKACKPGQEERVDLPAIGPETVIRCHGAGIRGIVAEAGKVLVLGREALIREADARGLFVTGQACAGE